MTAVIVLVAVAVPLLILAAMILHMDRHNRELGERIASLEIHFRELTRRDHDRR